MRYSKIYTALKTENAKSLKKMMKIAKASSKEFITDSEMRKVFNETVGMFIDSKSNHELFCDIHSFNLAANPAKALTFLQTVQMVCSYLDWSEGSITKIDFKDKVISKLNKQLVDAKAALKDAKEKQAAFKAANNEAALEFQTELVNTLNDKVTTAQLNLDTKHMYYTQCDLGYTELNTFIEKCHLEAKAK